MSSSLHLQLLTPWTLNCTDVTHALTACTTVTLWLTALRRSDYSLTACHSLLLAHALTIRTPSRSHSHWLLLSTTACRPLVTSTHSRTNSSQADYFFNCFNFSYRQLLKHFSTVLPELHSLDWAWSVDWYILRADSLKTPLATSVLLSCHVPRHHPSGSLLVCWPLPSRKRSPTVVQSLLLSDVICSITSRACADAKETLPQYYCFIMLWYYVTAVPKCFEQIRHNIILVSGVVLIAKPSIEYTIWWLSLSVCILLNKSVTRDKLVFIIWFVIYFMMLSVALIV
jgi:hypothetical protein